MTKDQAQAILTALVGIKDPYNAAIPAILQAQQTFGVELEPLVKKYNATSAAIQQSFNAIRAICALYATDHAPIIPEFTVTDKELTATFDYGDTFTISDAGHDTFELTVTGPGGTAKATAKA